MPPDTLPREIARAQPCTNWMRSTTALLAAASAATQATRSRSRSPRDGCLPIIIRSSFLEWCRARASLEGRESLFRDGEGFELVGERVPIDLGQATVRIHGHFIGRVDLE
jgi:hypothetical protein